MTLRTIGTVVLALLLVGCGYTIKLDPGADDAAVYVNGDLLGTGIARYDDKEEYGYSESFVARVVPASGSSQAYSVTIAREYDTGPALVGLGANLITAGTFLTVHYFSVKSQIDANPGNWPTLMFGGFNLGLLGAINLAGAPFNLLRFFKFQEYYDLQALREQEKAAGK